AAPYTMPAAQSSPLPWRCGPWRRWWAVPTGFVAFSGREPSSGSSPASPQSCEASTVPTANTVGGRAVAALGEVVKPEPRSPAAHPARVGALAVVATSTTAQENAPWIGPRPYAKKLEMARCNVAALSSQSALGAAATTTALDVGPD